MRKMIVLMAILPLFYFTTSIDKLDGSSRTRALHFESKTVCEEMREEMKSVLHEKYLVGQIQYWRVSDPCLRVEVIR